MTRLQWSVWIAGCVASLLVVIVMAFMKGAPAWYWPVFLVAATFCAGASAVSAYLRRTRRPVRDREGWLEAMKTARLGFLALIAIAVVLIVLVLFQVGK